MPYMSDIDLLSQYMETQQPPARAVLGALADCLRVADELSRSEPDEDSWGRLCVAYIEKRGVLHRVLLATKRD